MEQYLVGVPCRREEKLSMEREVVQDVERPRPYATD